MNRQIQALINRPFVVASIAAAALLLVAPFAAAQFAVPAGMEFAVGQESAALLQTGVTGRVTVANLNVRAGPSLGYTVLGTVKEDDTVLVVGRDSASAWLEIQGTGGTGWAGSKFIELVGTDTGANIPITAAYEPSATVSTGAANLRTGPGTSYAVIKALGYGSGMGLLGRNHDASWVYVRTPGEVFGWIASNLIKAELKDLFVLPVTSASGTPGGGSGGGGSVPPGGGGSGGGGTVPGGTGATGVTNKENIRVFARPDPNSTVIIVLGLGVPVELLGRNSSGTWLFVRVPTSDPPGATGWIAALLVDTNTSIMGLPVTDATGAPGQGAGGGGGTTPPGGGGTGGGGTGGTDGQGGGGPSAPPYAPGTAIVTTGALNVRTGPGIGFPVITTIQEGTLVMVLARNLDGSWYKIQLANGTIGWSSSLYLQFVVPPEDLPIDP